MNYNIKQVARHIILQIGLFQLSATSVTPPMYAELHAVLFRDAGMGKCLR